MSDATRPRVEEDSSLSSESSSEDEEEAKRIAAAVCDPGLLETFKSPKDKTASSASPYQSRTVNESQHQTNSKEGPPRKSNRPRDKNDVDVDNVLHTTPEFRSYVAKHLSEMLERTLSDKEDKKVWPTKEDTVKSDKGIRLFSDSQQLFKLDQPVPPSNTDSATANAGKPQLKRRKRRMSTSSESSDDERISCCVQTVSNIQAEAKRLATFEVITGSINSGTHAAANQQNNVMNNTTKVNYNNGSQRSDESPEGQKGRVKRDGEIKKNKMDKNILATSSERTEGQKGQVKRDAGVTESKRERIKEEDIGVSLKRGGEGCGSEITAKKKKRKKKKKKSDDVS